MNTHQLLIFGASGGTGTQLVEQALAAGHTVTAFVRDPSRLSLSHERLHKWVGDVTDAESVSQAMQGKSAVLVALGAPARDRSGVRQVGTDNVVRSMTKAGVQRIIVQSSMGVADSYAELPWYLKYFVVPLLLRRAFADHAGQERCLRDSRLRWTIVRPPFLTDGPKTQSFEHAERAAGRALKWKVSRADVAHFMLDQLDADVYLRKAPMLSY